MLLPTHVLDHCLFTGGAGGRPGVGSSLAQATVAVTEACSVGLVALRQQQQQDRNRQDANASSSKLIGPMLSGFVSWQCKCGAAYVEV